MDKLKIYFLGNPLDKNEKAMFQMIPALEKKFPEIEFIHLDPTEEIIWGELRGKITIIDTVMGLKKTQLFHSLKKFSLSPRVSVHDFDLPVDIGILTKLGKIKKLSLIGFPADIKRVKKTVEEVENILSEFICGSSCSL